MLESNGPRSMFMELSVLQFPQTKVLVFFSDGYVNQQTSIPLLFKQYERALEHSLEKEIEADYDTICTAPVLKTPSPMEQQAANLYTKKVFAKFQEELVETFVYTANKIEGDGIVRKYRVAKYEHDDKAYIVILNFSGIKASCSCQMFEYSGILCRHILTVFTVTNVLTLPSHYILKRWTRNAKSCVGLDEQSSDLQGIETLAMRFNNLCREAIKYAEEGAVAVETYNAAMSALQELQDYGKNPAGEKEVQFRLTRVTLEPMLRLMAYVSQQLSAPANRVAVINLKLQDTKTTSGETEVKFQVSRDTLGSMLRSMA
ncbi:protein FAR1-RELATED SEQUENCE 3 [Pyrus x bretschneideri]|uniref:protein FAR1-RELATED SEQUENCE 3 n=1 Tax=Pyrus x bretschneideri TaxID=225117 RepID=UPI00202E16C6|nr:protein FAR1-RELATED SEQUENCE 3 [Pyrus x bretschneideri]XP_048428687.1 protein FAR1-RELATED SEQUENCE 3 [Pyrus x bretschneideri]XP_048428688.1 protein FAR1-RELATED SEQUENCE 3 [Pyrus x bretschneideri]